MEVTSVATLLEIPSNNPMSYCRLCLSSSLVEPLLPESTKQDLLDLIANTVQVVLMIEEDLPCAVCQQCLQKLKDFERFRGQCQELHIFVRNKRRELALLEETAAAAAAVVDPQIVELVGVPEEIAIKADPEALLSEDDSLPYVLTEDSWHRCKFCAEAFQSLSVLLEHFRMRHPDESKIYKCPHCLRTYSSDLETNRTVTLPVRGTGLGAKSSNLQVDGIHVCEKCAVTFSPYQALLVHIQEHHWNDPPQQTFACSVCTKPFDKRRLLQYHILVAHLGQIPYACNHCGEWFRTKSHLKQHKTMFHERKAVTDNTCRCEFCGQMFQENEQHKQIDD